MSNCETVAWKLRRADRDYIGWPVTGVPAGAQAYALLEGGTPIPLVVGDSAVTGYFAGPDYVNPAPAAVVSTTSHVDIRIVTTDVSVTFDGGFIELVW